MLCFTGNMSTNFCKINKNKNKTKQKNKNKKPQEMLNLVSYGSYLYIYKLIWNDIMHSVK